MLRSNHGVCSNWNEQVAAAETTNKLSLRKKMENVMKHRKALLSEEQLLVTKERDIVRKASKRASETHEQTLHRQEHNQTHLARAKGSALQCCSV